MKYNRTVYRAMVMISQFGLNMLVPMLGCGMIGYFIDKALGTTWIAIALFFLGALAGFSNIYRMAKKIFEDKEPNEKAKRRQ